MYRTQFTVVCTLATVFGFTSASASPFGQTPPPTAQPGTAKQPAAAEGGFKEFALRASLFAGEKLLAGVVTATGEKLTDWAWNKTFGSDTDRLAEVDRRLATYQGLLEQVDAKVAGEIGDLRKELNTKTTPEDVQRIVNRTLTPVREKVQLLESQVGDLQRRTDKIDDRLKQIEDLFGRIPYVPPAPLLFSTVDTSTPKAHPLTLDWLKLLVRSEQSRLKLVELRRVHPDTSSKVKAALTADQSIVTETATLHDKAKRELADKLIERQAMLAEHKDTSPAMIEFDDRLSAVMWLVAVTKPIPTGEYAGRLGVPPVLMGPQASEIVIALRLADADREAIALYYDIFRGSANVTKLHHVTPVSYHLNDDMIEVVRNANGLISYSMLLYNRAHVIDKRLKAALEIYSSQHPDVVKLNNEKIELINDISRVYYQLIAIANQATQVLVKTLYIERINNTRMSNYVDSVVKPVFSWLALTNLSDSSTDAERQTAWRRILSAESNKYNFGQFVGHDFQITCVAISPDGNTIASAGFGRTVKLWRAGFGSCFRTISGYQGAQRAVAISPDSKYVVAGGYGGEIVVHDIESGEKKHTLAEHKDSVHSICYNSTGNRLITSDGKGVVIVWNAVTYKRISSIYAHDMSCTSAIVSPNCKLLVTAGVDDAIHVWSINNLRKIATINEHRDTIKQVTYHHSGHYFATCSRDGTVKIWSSDKNKCIATLADHGIDVFGVMYSPDGTMLATTSGSKIIIYSTASYTPIITLPFQDGVTSPIVWSNDGKALIAACDNKIKIIDTSEFILNKK